MSKPIPDPKSIAMNQRRLEAQARAAQAHAAAQARAQAAAQARAQAQKEAQARAQAAAEARAIQKQKDAQALAERQKQPPVKPTPPPQPPVRSDEGVTYMQPTSPTPPPTAKVIANPLAQGRTPVYNNYGPGYVDPRTLMGDSPPASYKKGGQVKAKPTSKVKSSKASSRGDGIAQRGKTRGTMR